MLLQRRERHNDHTVGQALNVGPGELAKLHAGLRLGIGYSGARLRASGYGLALMASLPLLLIAGRGSAAGRAEYIWRDHSRTGAISTLV